MNKKEQQQDLDINLFEKILKETEAIKSRLYLWGGEPLCYDNFDKVANMLVKDPREVSICTNGLLIKEHLDSIIKISDNLELLIPVEGFKEEHDLIRGNGNFEKVIENLKLIMDLKENGIYKGKVSIHTVINDNISNKLYDLVDFFENMKIDMLLLCYPWYISKNTACKMDNYFYDNFSWLKAANEKKNKSWHSFTYKLNIENLPSLKEQIDKINKRLWSLRVRFQPDLELENIEQFILGSEVECLQNKSCLAVSTRMDIYPDGGVSSCKFFSEFTIGNITNTSISEVWHSSEYDCIRETINTSLTPVCSKCNLLHLHGN